MHCPFASLWRNRGLIKEFCGTITNALTNFVLKIDPFLRSVRMRCYNLCDSIFHSMLEEHECLEVAGRTIENLVLWLVHIVKAVVQSIEHFVVD